MSFWKLFNSLEILITLQRQIKTAFRRRSAHAARRSLPTIPAMFAIVLLVRLHCVILIHTLVLQLPRVLLDHGQSAAEDAAVAAVACVIVGVFLDA